MTDSNIPPLGFAYPSGYDPMRSSLKRLATISEVVPYGPMIEFRRHGNPAVLIHFHLDAEILPGQWSHMDTNALRHSIAARWSAIEQIHRLIDGQEVSADQWSMICRILEEECGLPVRDPAEKPEIEFPIVVRPDGERWNLFLRDRDIGPISMGHLNQDLTGYSTRDGAEDALDEIKQELTSKEFMADLAPGFERIIGESVTIKFDTLLSFRKPVLVSQANPPVDDRIVAALGCHMAGGTADMMARILEQGG